VSQVKEAQPVFETTASALQVAVPIAPPVDVPVAGTD
jgi:hypothetical protein